MCPLLPGPVSPPLGLACHLMVHMLLQLPEREPGRREVQFQSCLKKVSFFSDLVNGEADKKL